MKNGRTIIFYGVTWCADCRRSRQYLDSLGVSYDYRNIEEDPMAADEVVEVNKRLQSIPTIVFPDSTVLIEPSNEELQKAFDANKSLTIAYRGEAKQ